MRSLHRCWHVTSRTFHDDDDVNHDDGCDDVEQTYLLKEKLNIVCFKIIIFNQIGGGLVSTRGLGWWQYITFRKPFVDIT